MLKHATIFHVIMQLFLVTIQLGSVQTVMSNYTKQCCFQKCSHKKILCDALMCKSSSITVMNTALEGRTEKQKQNIGLPDSIAK